MALLLLFKTKEYYITLENDHDDQDLSKKVISQLFRESVSKQN